MKCKSYHLRRPLCGWEDAYTPIFGEEYGICWATKEVERCDCNGDTNKCDFYLSVRQKDTDIDKAIKLLESHGYKVIKDGCL